MDQPFINCRYVRLTIYSNVGLTIYGEAHKTFLGNIFFLSTLLHEDYLDPYAAPFDWDKVREKHNADSSMDKNNCINDGNFIASGDPSQTSDNYYALIDSNKQHQLWTDPELLWFNTDTVDFPVIVDIDMGAEKQWDYFAFRQYDSNYKECIDHFKLEGSIDGVEYFTIHHEDYLYHEYINNNNSTGYEYDTLVYYAPNGNVPSDLPSIVVDLPPEPNEDKVITLHDPWTMEKYKEVKLRASENKKIFYFRNPFNSYRVIIDGPTMIPLTFGPVMPKAWG